MAVAWHHVTEILQAFSVDLVSVLLGVVLLPDAADLESRGETSDVVKSCGGAGGYLIGPLDLLGNDLVIASSWLNSSGIGVLEVTRGVLQGRLDSKTVGVLDVLNGSAAEDGALWLGDGGFLGA